MTRTVHARQLPVQYPFLGLQAGCGTSRGLGRLEGMCRRSSIHLAEGGATDFGERLRVFHKRGGVLGFAAAYGLVPAGGTCNRDLRCGAFGQRLLRILALVRGSDAILPNFLCHRGRGAGGGLSTSPMYL